MTSRVPGRPCSPLDTEEADFLGLPGLLTPEQTAALLAARDVELRRRSDRARGEASRPGGNEVPAAWREVEDLRREVNRLVARGGARTGRRHADIDVELRRAVPGRRSASATFEVLLARRDHLLSA